MLVDKLPAMEQHPLVSVQLCTPFIMIINGSTQCGKTTLIKKILLRQNEIIDKKFEKILYCYAYSLPMFELENVEFNEGLPTNFDGLDNGLLILDDLMEELSKSKSAIDLFTKKSHHQNISIIFVTHNFFFKNLRNLTTQCKYICLMKNPRENAYVKNIGRQMNMGLKNEPFEQAFECVMNKPFGHLLLDFNMNQRDDMRIRTSVFPEDCIVFTQCKFYLL